MVHADLSGRSRRLIEESMTRELGHAPNQHQLSNRVEELRGKKVELSPSSLAMYFEMARAGKSPAASQGARAKLRR